MKNDFNKILDICLERISKGEAVDTVLADYPAERDRLEPLVRASLTISRIPKVKPSPEFLHTSKTSLLRQIYSEPAAARKSRTSSGFFSRIIADIRESFTARRSIPVAVSVLLVAVLVFTVGQFTFLKPSAVYAASCYLRILSGNVSIMEEGTDSFTGGSDGMSLETGDTVKTDTDSHALLAFFDGSTIKLDPGTTLEIVEMTRHEDESPTIILKQWVGRTWSRVEKMIDSDADSSYEIVTPSATAVVRGTLFTTEVSNNGSTSVETTQGLVSVFGEDEEVFVSPNKKTEVLQGGKPSTPKNTPLPVTQIVITLEGPVAGSVNDPTGSSTGQFPDGTGFNQIPGSVSSISPEGYQVITISDPAPGNYNLTLRYLDQGTVNYHIMGISGDQVVFNFPGLIDVDEDGSIVNFDLKSTGNELGINTVKVKELGDNAPEKTVNQNEFKQEKADKAQNKTESKEQHKNQETVNATADDASSVKTNQGNSENSNQDKDNSGNKDKDKETGSDNSGKSEDAGTNTGVQNGNSSNKNKDNSTNTTADTGTSADKGNSKDKTNNSSGNSNSANNYSNNSSTNNGNGNNKDEESDDSSSGNGNNKNKDTEDTSGDTTQEEDTGNNGNGNGNGNSNDNSSTNGNGSSSDKDKDTGNDKSSSDKSNNGNSNKNKKSDDSDNGTSDNSTDTDLQLDISDIE